MQHDSRTLSEIVNDRDIPEGEFIEPDEEMLDSLEPREIPEGFTNRPASIEHALNFAPDIHQARETAQIPPQLSVKEVVGKTFVIVDKVKQKAALPDTGEMRDGWQCLCADVETRKSFTMWIGQVALVSDLNQVALPFRTTITKKGRTYQFS